jgi:hypothetical protein
VDENINHSLGSEPLIVYYGLHYIPFLKCLEVKDEERIRSCGVGPNQVFEIREKSKKICLGKGVRRAFWALKRAK